MVKLEGVGAAMATGYRQALSDDMDLCTKMVADSGAINQCSVPRVPRVLWLLSVQRGTTKWR